MSTAAWTMSTEPMSTSTAVAAAGPPVRVPLFKSCWSCRILSGGALLLSAGYVYSFARKGMLRGGQTSPGTVFQISFALALASWGIVVIADPVGKSHRADGKPCITKT